jgi:hypothetical protein
MNVPIKTTFKLDFPLKLFDILCKEICMSRSNSFGPFFFLQISLGIYFAILGIVGLQARDHFFKGNNILDLVIAIVLLVAGIFLIVSLFAPIGGNLTPILYLATIIIWAIIGILIPQFINGFFKPGFLEWLSALAGNVAILSGLWVVTQKD